MELMLSSIHSSLYTVCFLYVQIALNVFFVSLAFEVLYYVNLKNKLTQVKLSTLVLSHMYIFIHKLHI